MEHILVTGAREKNLKNISVAIPKRKITVFTGVSGSGKSSLVFDTIAAESQRQLTETYPSFIRSRMPKYSQPDADSIQNLPVAFIINQKRLGGNARSTVGTITDIYSTLRLLLSRIGEPFVGFSDVFSFNNPGGMCEHCSGLGKTDTINVKRLLDLNKSLNEGAILFPSFEPGSWRITRYVNSGFFDNDKALKDYSEEEMELLLYKDGIKVPPNPDWPKTSLYEGVVPRIERSFIKKEGVERERYKSAVERVVIKEPCPVCGGRRLNEKVLSCKINGKNIADCSSMQLDDLLAFIKTVQESLAATMTAFLIKQLEQLVDIGLGYLSLDRETSTLSGGESQRIKMIKQLGSSLSDVTYIFDEPSIGLHPYNVDKINSLLQLLRDKGNTVLVVEHDPDIICTADHIIDMGPQAGKNGGEVVYEGTFPELLKADTLTGRYLSIKPEFKRDIRAPKGYLNITDASLHNIQNLSVKIPLGVMVAVTGVAGSGKSTLTGGILPEFCPDAVFIDQKKITATKRSNITTFTDISDSIRKLFAKANGVSASLFSYNSKGACPACKGMGVIHTELAFMDAVVTVCDMCHGERFTDEVLGYTLNGKSINDVLKMTVDEAVFFNDEKTILSVLKLLQDVGLGYIALGQPLDSFSGGELQRAKLTAELSKKGNIYIMDEPTTGLHISDTARLAAVLDRLVDNGNSLIIIEHNLDMVARADWAIDIGPYAGRDGGKILFEGRPADMINTEASITGQYLRKYRT